MEFYTIRSNKREEISRETFENEVFVCKRCERNFNMKRYLKAYEDYEEFLPSFTINYYGTMNKSIIIDDWHWNGHELGIVCFDCRLANSCTKCSHQHFPMKYNTFGDELVIECDEVYESCLGCAIGDRWCDGCDYLQCSSKTKPYLKEILETRRGVPTLRDSCLFILDSLTLHKYKKYFF